jgi:GAF domain-containing protein
MPYGEPAAGAVQRDRQLDELLRMTRELLEGDIALLTEIRAGREVAMRGSGEWPGLAVGGSLPLSETFCARMLEGRIGNHIADARADERVSDLAMAHQLHVGSWMGMPIRLDNMRLYVLCCLAREARPGIGERELRLLAGLAESVKATLGRE